MKYYNQSDLFQVLLSAALADDLRPNTQLLANYKRKRLAAAERAIRTRNVFLFTEDTRAVTNLPSTSPTVYTQPAGERLIVVGYSNNLRFGFTSQNDTSANPAQQIGAIFPQMHRLRIVGNNERAICDDLTPAEGGIVGEPRYTSTYLTVPLILEPNEQIAIDLGYDATAPANATFVFPEAFIVFALKVKDHLTPDDQDSLADAKRFIDAHDFQRGQYLNVLEVNTQGPIRFIPAAPPAGSIAVAETRPVTNPMLITGIGTNLGASTIKITDTADGSSFSLDRPMRVSALNMPNYEGSGNTSNAPAGAPDWTNYFTLPFPHFLKAGAQLRVDLVNGSTDWDNVLVTDPVQGDIQGRPGPVVMFQGIDV